MTYAPALSGPSTRQSADRYDPLRRVLRFDAWSTAAFGVLLLVAGPWLREPLGLPLNWSIPFGVALLGGAAALALIAGYAPIPARLALTVVACNELCGVALLAIVLCGVLDLTALGVAFFLVGMLAVVTYAGLEYRAYRHATSSAPE